MLFCEISSISVSNKKVYKADVYLFFKMHLFCRTDAQVYSILEGCCFYYSVSIALVMGKLLATWTHT